MTDSFLKDAQKIVTRLERDLRARCDDMPEVGRAVEAEYKRAKAANRTGQTLEEWRADAITQQAVAWVLSCVFARFLEDNKLVDPPKLAGPGDRLARARDEHELFFRANPKQTDREYLFSVFDDLAKRPGTADLYGPHNPVRAVPNWLSPDAAKDVLLPFFQKIDAGTGELVYDFTDPAQDTRFLGDLYQDLSEAARKKYALLQTPVFVEEFILDRTLEPAIETFGLAAVKLIDPACGSGHFLLGAFQRLLAHWQKKEPATARRELVARALGAVHGVDLNPYAVAIARFRLQLAAWAAAGVATLRNAPDFKLNLACGDSLLHGSQKGAQGTLNFEATDHHYAAEDAADLNRILQSGTYHAVVANPPYITPKDKAASEQYRERYSACHRQYSLSVPFMQRIFDLACEGGFTGQITANSFMKREFGKKLIEEFFPRVDLTHVIDTSGAYIPGHGTPTVILFGRNQKPVMSTIRTAMGIRGEPGIPEDPAHGLVWTAINQQISQPGSESRFVSVDNSMRATFHHHPWSIGGGGAADLKELLDERNRQRLCEFVSSIGFSQDTHADDIFVQPKQFTKRFRLSWAFRPQIRGEEVRDWIAVSVDSILFPYDKELNQWSSVPYESEWSWLHALRTELWSRSTFGGGTYQSAGRPWFDYHQFPKDRARTPFAITLGEVATHNHFVFKRGRIVFNRTAPIIKLIDTATDTDYLSLLGLLNSSTACFLLKQVCFDKGNGGIGGGIGDEKWERRSVHDGSKVGKLALPEERPLKLTQRMDEYSGNISECQPGQLLARWEAALTPSHKHTKAENLSDDLTALQKTAADLRGQMVRLQEDLDWQCYRLYGLMADDLADPKSEGRDLPVKLGERAFEIVLARKMRDEGLHTTWFERHGSTPITEVPAHWPADYRALVERRLAVIAANPQIALIEQPEYKRRWNDTPWAEKVAAALHDWLLDRLESYFDFDGRMNDAAKPTNQVEIALLSAARLADIAAKDKAFETVGTLYRQGQGAEYKVEKLVAELVEAESVPLLPVLRYKPAGLDKRTAWERTWALQRREDAIDARVSAAGITANVEGWTAATDDGASPLNPSQAKVLKQHLVDPAHPQSIPVPPKYKSADFQKPDYWRLRGGLDVPKERWVSFPHCEGADNLPLIAWAGYDHLQLAKAIAAHYVHVQEQEGGRDDPRLAPLLAGLAELIPWLKQWHNEPDPEFGYRMGDYYEGFVQDEARGMGKTVEEVKAWTPPARGGRRRTQR